MTSACDEHEITTDKNQEQISSDVSQNSSVNEPAGKKNKSADWFVISLILIVVVNIGIYVYASSSSPKIGENVIPRTAPQNYPPPGDNSASLPSEAPGQYIPPFDPFQRPPAPGQAPKNTRIDLDLADFLNSDPGKAALEELKKKPAPLGVTSSQQKKLAEFLEAKGKGFNTGVGVIEITGLLNQEQLDFLRTNKNLLRKMPGQDTVQTLKAAVKTLKDKGVTVVPKSQEGDDEAGQLGAPEFDPCELANGVVLLEKEGPGLTEDMEKASQILQLLEQMTATEELNMKGINEIFTPQQMQFFGDNLAPQRK